ncbi:transcriptional regulator [Photobacterium swingsii]|uniref:winged helix-turn-helix domain-containing protein n=1 Tax=Photobacterium swingsii TaxID=680026 RepID=UPI00352D93F1
MWCFDPTARWQLTHTQNSTAKKLKSTDSKILEMLLLHQGHVVSKKELENAAWPGRFVSKSSLTQSIAQLRFALGDSGREQKIIKTLPKQGYMLVSNVMMMKINAQPKPAQAPVIVAPVQAEEQSDLSSQNTQIIPNNPESTHSCISSSPGISRIQWCLLLLLSISLIMSSYWLTVMIYKNNHIVREKWQQTSYQGVRYFFEPKEQGEQLFNWLKDTYSDNLRMLYLSKNLEQLYVSCTYLSGSLKERKVTNMSFIHNFSPEDIKRAIREQCQ